MPNSRANHIPASLAILFYNNQPYILSAEIVSSDHSSQPRHRPSWCSLCIFVVFYWPFSGPGRAIGPVLVCVCVCVSPYVQTITLEIIDFFSLNIWHGDSSWCCFSFEGPGHRLKSTVAGWLFRLHYELSYYLRMLIMTWLFFGYLSSTLR